MDPACVQGSNGNPTDHRLGNDRTIPAGGWSESGALRQAGTRAARSAPGTVHGTRRMRPLSQTNLVSIQLIIFGTKPKRLRFDPTGIVFVA